MYLHVLSYLSVTTQYFNPYLLYLHIYLSTKQMYYVLYKLYNILACITKQYMQRNLFKKTVSS